MEQRRKIIIPTGADPEETLSTPHFDTEATLSARPVVPLAEPVALPPEDAYAVQQQVGASYPPAAATASPWKRSTLILIILVAVGLGVASGLAIGLYQSRTRTSAPVVAQPSPASDEQQAARQPEPQIEQPPVVAQPETEQPESEAQIPVAPAVEEPERKPAGDAVEDDKQASPENRKRDETRATPPVIRNRPTVDDTDIERDERDERRERREERREQRREERRAERRRQRQQNDDDPLDVPRNVERARQEINRIRDIFEGRQP